MNERIRESDFHDKLLTCLECSHQFIFSAGEQAFFTSKRLCPPKRCKSCRKARRLTIVQPAEVGNEQ